MPLLIGRNSTQYPGSTWQYSTKDGGKIVRMSEASVKDIYRSIMYNGAWKRVPDNELATDWRRCVWDKQLLPKLQVFLYRLRTGSLLCGSRMGSMRSKSGRDTACLRGCGESHPDMHHDLQGCPKLGILINSAITVCGWQREKRPLYVIWSVSREKMSKEMREEEGRRRAHIVSALYVAYLDSLETHFEDSTLDDTDRARRWQRLLLALSRDVRLYTKGNDSLARSNYLQETSAAVLLVTS